MTHDTAGGNRTDVKFVQVGSGQPITRRCDAPKGQWLCDARISFKGICDDCKKASMQRKARAAG